MFKNNPLIEIKNMTLTFNLTNFSIKTKSLDALKDISLKIYEGDKIAITGKNGAGKSSLLRVIAGIYPPTNGEVLVNGTKSAMLNPTAGMMMGATGIENIYIRGLLLGIPKGLIDEKLQDIINFADLGEFINYPISKYSKGMRLRLAFGISTINKPDILLIDEWVNAGDKEFREKSKIRLNDIISNSGCLLLASHSENVIKNYCNKVMRLEEGKIKELINI